MLFACRLYGIAAVYGRCHLGKDFLLSRYVEVGRGVPTEELPVREGRVSETPHLLVLFLVQWKSMI